jgi:hypothetical protein
MDGMLAPFGIGTGIGSDDEVELRPKLEGTED